MSLIAHAVVHYDTGKPVPVETTGSQKILSGWIGVYSATRDELRLFCVLLPGDVITGVKDCSMRALTPVEVEPSEESQTLTETFSRHCFRLAHYRAKDRLADFLSDVQQRLHKANGSAGERFVFPLSQQQMGELLGMSTVHVNRTLQALRPVLRIKDHHAHIESQQEFAASLR